MGRPWAGIGKISWIPIAELGLRAVYLQRRRRLDWLFRADLEVYIL